MSDKNFYCDVDKLNYLLRFKELEIYNLKKYKKLLTKKSVDLRVINQIIKNDSKLYNFSKINYNLLNKINKKKKKKNFRVLDLFCGAGGFSKGFEMSGFNIENSIDFNEIFIKTHKVNFSNSNSLLLDLNNFDPSNLKIKKKYFDVIIGSPPCQTFSSIGQGKIKSLSKNIKNDIRNYLYFSFIRFVKFFKPNFFLLENVPGFKTKYNGEMLNDFIDKLKDEYSISYKIIDAKNFSVPQSRKRLFVFGQLRKIKKKLDIFKNIEHIKNKNTTVNEAISDLPKITDDWRLDSLFYSKNSGLSDYQKKMRSKKNKTVCNNICRVSNIAAKKLFSYLRPGDKYSDLNEDVKKKNLFI